MKKRWMKIAAALYAAAIFAAMAGGCGDKAADKGEPVETVISGLGIGDTYFDPPEQVTVQIEERDMTYIWEYRYTADIPLDFADTNIGGFSGLSDITYYYEDEDGYELRMDEQGRVIGYRAPLREDAYRWQADSLSEDALFAILEQALDEIAGVSIDGFPDQSFVSGDTGKTFYLYQDEDSPFTDAIVARFMPSGSLYSIAVQYNGVESVSAEDEAYFAGMMEEYLLSAGKSQRHTVETHYEAHGSTLIARFTVTYHDPEQGAWVENYVAGKSLQ